MQEEGPTVSGRGRLKSWEPSREHFRSSAQKVADTRTPAQEISFLGKVLETFRLPPVYNFLFSLECFSGGLEFVKEFRSKWNRRIEDGKPHKCDSGRQDVRTERLISRKCLIHRKQIILEFS